MGCGCCAPDDEDEERKPMVYIAIPLATAKGLKAGEMVTVAVQGKLKMVTTRDKEKLEKWDDPANIEVEIDSVKVTGKGEFDDMLDD